MASQLPTIPWFVFTVFEPISLLAGAIPAILAPGWFASQQTFQLTGSIVPKSQNETVMSGPALMVTRQLGNTYGVAALVALAVLYTTSEVKVVRNYLIALWICDIGHVVITVLGLGYERGVAVGDWNAMTWGNIGATLFLFLTRSAYFLGLFGEDGKRPTSQYNKDKKSQ
ncbi:hypothetical protein V8F33_008358 [Rhypophila sp. PSN 637]